MYLPGEALGAIGDSSSKEILKKYSTHQCQEIAETCQIALRKIEASEASSKDANGAYNTKDPAYSLPEKEVKDPKNIQELRQMLLSPDTNLYSRYEAMFTLRNIGTKEAIMALCDGA